MDVSVDPQIGICCDVCGYPREGLPVDALCPECGEVAPAFASGSRVPDRTVGQLAWIRIVAVGLWMLLISSVGALQVALITPAYQYSVGTINFPGPKVHASSMVQRNIGGQPGPWGVSGILWAMGSVVGVWLITERRAMDGSLENGFSLRAATRYTAVITGGGALGLLLSQPDVYIAPGSTVSLSVYLIVVVFCELPANILLYLYLDRLAKRFEERRSAPTFNACQWLVPIVIVGGAILLLTAHAASNPPGGVWRAAAVLYGCVALAAGVAATAAVGRLALVAAAAGIQGSVRETLASAPRLIRQASASIDAHRTQCCVIVGLVLLLWSTSSGFDLAFRQSSRNGLAGNVPFLNFPGPKVVSTRAAAALHTEHGDVDGLPSYLWPLMSQLLAPVFMNLLGVWLVTAKDTPANNNTPARPRLRWRGPARWAATVAVAGPIGFVMSRTWNDAVSASRTNALVIVLFEAPATCLLYLHLAQLGSEGTRKNLKRFAWIAPVVMCVPLTAFALSASLRHWHSSMSISILGGLYLSIAMAATLTASFAIGRLAWELVRGVLHPPAAPTSLHGSHVGSL